MDRPAHPLTMTVLTTPETANFAGNVQGGTILKFIAQVACAFASPCAGEVRKQLRQEFGRRFDAIKGTPAP